MRAETICFYGPSTVGKTTQLGEMIELFLEWYPDKAIRLISADGGGWGPIQHYVDAGLVDALDLTQMDSPLSAIRRLWEGLWWDGKRWEPPTGATSAYLIEGITTISQLLLAHLTATGRRINEDVIGKFQEDGLTFGAPGRSHYGFVQNIVYQMIAGFRGLPVDYVIWTAHEAGSRDDKRQRYIFGPASVGNVATSILPGMLGDMFHFAGIPQGSEIDVSSGKKMPTMEMRAFYRDHPDPQTGLMFPAKVRAPAMLRPVLLQKWPDGYIPLTLDKEGNFSSSIAHYYRLMHEQKKTLSERTEALRNRIRRNGE